MPAGTEVWEEGATKPHWANKASAAEYVKSEESIQSLLPAIQAQLPLRTTELAPGALVEA